MKNLKKVLALVLACVMVFGTVAMAGSVYPDVADDAIYAESVKTLSALGIIKGDENGNFNPDATVTRAEMAKILCTMLGTGELSQASTKFSDVPSSHWASGYVNYAQQYGCIAGYGDGTFGPEDPVTYEQAIKLIMAALGYTPMAEENGGYPTGYLYVAADAEVTERAVGYGSEPATRGTIAILANNAMDTPLMERTTYGTDAYWHVLDGKTANYPFKSLLTSRHKTYRVEGKVENTSLGQPALLKEGYVQTSVLDYFELSTADISKFSSAITNLPATCDDAADYVGYISYLYYKVDDAGDASLICVVPKSARNKVIEIDNVANVYNASLDSNVRASDTPKVVWADVASGSYDVDHFVFSYWNDRDTDNRITTVKLEPNTSVYVNKGGSKSVDMGTAPVKGTDTFAHLNITNVNDANYTTSLGFYNTTAVLNSIVPERGSMTLVDTDNNGEYDLIKVTTSDIAVVDSVNANKNRINFKSEGISRSTLADGSIDNRIILTKDANKFLEKYSITIDGAAADIADIQKDDVLSITTNSWDDPTYVDIAVTRNVVEGTVTAKSVNSIPPYVVIGGEKYEVAADVDNGSGSALTIAAIDVKDEGKFFLDAEGKIVYASTNSTISGDYAYLYGVSVGDFGQLKVTLFTKDGKATYVVNEDVEINEVEPAAANDEYTAAELKEIFNLTTTPSGTTVNDVFTGTVSGDNAPATGDNVTPAVILKALAGGVDVTRKAGYNIKVGSSTVANKLAKFITYEVNADKEITSIGLAVNGAATDEFGYLASAGSAIEWQESLGKFKSGTYASIPEDAVLFFIPDGKTIDDYSVKTVADLADGADYIPNYFTNTDDGAAAVVFFQAGDPSLAKDSFAVFESVSETTVDGEKAFLVSYWKDGVEVATPLTVMNSGVTYTGAISDVNSDSNTNVLDIREGDTFLYSEDEKGHVKDISVVFTPNVAPTISTGGIAEEMFGLQGTTASAWIDIDATINTDFQLMNGAVAGPDNEVIFGIIAQVKSNDNVRRVTLFNNDGSTAQTVNISDSAKILYYNNTNVAGKKISAAELADITPSSVSKQANSTAIDFSQFNTKFDASDFNYLFVRTYNGVATEVIVVRYTVDD